MQPLRLLSAAGQVAAHLRSELESGRWTVKMPGVNHLAAELAVNRKTVESALRQLERDGVLQGQGPGRMRRICLSSPPTRRVLRIALQLCEKADRHLDYIVELQHALVQAGHLAFVTGKSLLDIGMKVDPVRRFVKSTTADAWIVLAGSRGVLEWFSAQSAPVFALFGPHTGLPMAGSRPDKPAAYAAAARHLTGLGHERIVIISRRMGSPQPRLSEQAFLDELAACGIRTGEFNLPVWTETREGLQQLLQSIFRFTPPTALVVDEAPLFAATQQFLAARGIRVPQQVSLICTDPDSSFAWSTPTISHIYWDAAPIVRRIIRWAASVSQGTEDLAQTKTKAEFIPGGTTGPVMA